MEWIIPGLLCLMILCLFVAIFTYIYEIIEKIKEMIWLKNINKRR